MEQVQMYLHKITTGLKPALGFVITVINFLLFPNQAFYTAFFAVISLSILDILTKYIAISKNNEGFFKAFKTNLLFSKTFWHGTSIKIKSYLMIFILMGIGYRMSPIEQIQSTLIYFSTYVFIIIFLRELQSCVENLIEAGYEMGWFLKLVKLEQFKILNKMKGSANNKEKDKDA